MELQNTNDSTPLANVEQLIKQLDALQPGKQQQKAALFRSLYPAIESALARDVPQKIRPRTTENRVAPVLGWLPRAAGG